MTSITQVMSEAAQELRVNMTKDLSIFKFLKGNRPPNPQHIKRLIKSIKTYGMLCNPILVNEKHEIIDGQHRYLAAKEARSGIYYIIVKGYALSQVHTLNMNQKNWTKTEFLHGYANMGIESYIILRDFWNQNKWLKLGDCIALCSNVSSSVAIQKERIWKSGTVETKSNNFRAGTWKVRDLNKARINAAKLKSIEPYFREGYNQSTFVGTMLTLFNNKNYNHEHFLRKLQIQPSGLIRQATREQYKLLVESIYNYRSRNKVNLRY